MDKLAEKVSTSRGQIYNLEKGNRQLTQRWMERLAAALHCAPTEFISSSAADEVPVVADVGAGAKICPHDDLPLYRNGLREVDRLYANCDFAEVPPGFHPSEILAVRVKGDSMMPFMPEGTVVYYKDRNGDISQCLKKLCIVKTKGGEAYLKILKKGEQYGRYNLVSYNASEIENVEIEWAAKVVFVKMG